MREGCGMDAGGMREGCGRDAGGMRERCGRDVGIIYDIFMSRVFK
jgi:hypothetical protein